MFCFPNLLENIVILCFEKRFSKQNDVIRLKSYTFAPPKFFAPSKFLGWLCHCVGLLIFAQESNPEVLGWNMRETKQCFLNIWRKCYRWFFNF